MFKIETWENNPILRKVADEVKKEEFKKALTLWKKMLKYIKEPENWWVWLAAPQIWFSLKLIIVSMLKDRDDEEFKTIMIINPEILEYSKETSIEQEWCLSVPWIKWDIERPIKIKLSFYDEKNKQKTLILEWLQARIVQHEVDHVNWKLFIDYLK